MRSSHTVVAFDTETALIRPALLAPPLVCITWQQLNHAACIEHVSTAEPRIRAWLEDPNVILVGHNVAYDLAVIIERFPALRSLVFAAYAADRVTDTMIRQQLLDIAGGVYRGRLVGKNVWVAYNYGLEDLTRRLTEIRLLKDGWRLSYGEFLDTPLAEWPRRAREVQAAARVRLARLLAQATGDPEEEIAKTIATQTTIPNAPTLEDKALQKTIEGLVEMINGDPDRASSYPLDDARGTLAVYLAQEVHVAFLADQWRQARAAFALHLSSAWGLRTDAAGVEMLRAATQASYDELEDELIQLGLIRDDKKRSRDTKLAKARMVRVCAEEDLPLRRTDGHTEESTKCKDANGNTLPGGDDACVEHICLDAEACTATGDDVLTHYAEISTLKKQLSNDIPMMLAGVVYPVHTRYSIAETGRTTSAKPPIQNQTKRAGFRECFCPRCGCVFGQADYPAVEMFTWAQCCVSWLGRSKLADALNAGLDPHLMAAGVILGISYDEAKRRHEAGDQEVDDVRQLAKVGNFGWPGGMGPPTMLKSIKKQLKPAVVARLGLNLARVERLREEWREAWPEAEPYFARVKSLGPPYPQKFRATVETLFTQRFRGGAAYCATANYGFQALASDIGKEAMWRVSREQYDVPTSPLFDTRTVAFVHDEIIIEAPEARAHEAAMRLADVMVEGANVYLPDVPIPRAKLKPVLMRRWSKKAKPVVGADGRLIPWQE